MNIVDKLTNRGTEPELDQEQKMRHDVLFTQLRVKTGLPSENIDLSGVDFSITDDELRAAVARERGLTSEGAAEQIDLDEVIIPSGKALRRAIRTQQRAQDKKRRRGQRRFNQQQRARRFATSSRVSGSTLVKQRRAEKAAQRAIAALLLEMHSEIGYEQRKVPTPAHAEARLREEGHPAILHLDALRAA